ncbi:MAG: endopeptidase La [Bdellovibrionota bacterium]
MDESSNEAPVLSNSELVAADALLPQTLFVIPIQTSPVFPGMVTPLVLSKAKLVETVEHALANRGIVGLILTKEDSTEHAHSEGLPNSDLPRGLYSIGTAVRIIKKLNTSDGGMTVLVHSLKRFRVKKVVREEPYSVVQVEYLDDILEKSIELDALTRSVVSQVKKLSETNPFFSEEIKIAMVNAPGAAALADLVAFALSLKKEDAQDFLETTIVRERFEKLLFHLKKEQEVADLQRKINEDVNQKIHRMQREFFLREQMRSIRRELGGEEEGPRSAEKYRERIEQTKLSEEAKKVALEELGKLETLSDSSPEYNVTRNYLDWMLSLPWGALTEDNLDLKNAKKVLEEDHYGIPKVKNRILEYLAVRKLNPSAKGSVLCLVGPPGVGKTSLGKSIARAMGRKFFRFSLGGMRDEAEIKGHRRTYIGAMPGKILSSLKRSGSQNPVLLLDEVDKLGASFQGDPASALLEVLDPEQNQSFLDHYLDVPFDLSNVMFVVTANTTASIPAPLLDRMEVIELNGYTFEEKEQIARTHVMPRELERHGLKAEQVEIPKATLERIMTSYCREPGMRSLQQSIAAILRRVASQIVENLKLRKVTIKPTELYEYLGPERFENEVLRRVQSPGVVVGLAWTPLGGQVLFVEAGDVPRRLSKVGLGHVRNSVAASEAEAVQAAREATFGQFKLTGQLGEVMTESAAIAYSYVKKKTKTSKVARKFFDENDIHVHVPAGAIPKDGPSAGVTMATALLSLVTGNQVKKGVAMTGELSLTGKVLPVGGIREKVLAAKRAGIHTIILPKQNKKDLKEIPDPNLKGLKFVFADTVEDVFKNALQH